MTNQRPKEHDYASYVSYGRALEDYCDALEGQLQEQKPVAWMYTSKWRGNERFITHFQTDLSTYKAEEVWPLYTTPPRREWAGLTREELIEIHNQKDWDITYGWDYEQAIEAKLKEKNT
jgi:hypothetical protein